MTPLGEAQIHFVYDAGDDVYWGCFQKATCEMWWWRGPYIRYGQNITEGYGHQSPIVLPDDIEEAMGFHRKRAKIEKI
jgi:hypothetical protein